MRTHGRRDAHDEANSRSLIFQERALNCVNKRGSNKKLLCYFEHITFPFCSAVHSKVFLLHSAAHSKVFLLHSAAHSKVFLFHSAVHSKMFLLHSAVHSSCLCHFPLHMAHACLSSAEHGTFFRSVLLLSLVHSKCVVNGYGQGDRGSIPANFLLDALCSGVKWPQRKPDRRTTSRKEVRHAWSNASAPLYFFMEKY
jgi:hypothetical protein